VKAERTRLKGLCHGHFSFCWPFGCTALLRQYHRLL
jgi:hypothetical protein